jgi:FKBP-type peptidyl-prolyl cis-trans isomerase
MDKIKKLCALLFVAMLVLAACGGGDSDSDSEAGGGDSADTADCSQETVEMDSGLKYEEIECGDGEEAASGDTLTVHYVGTLADGTKFDSSRDRGQPFTVQIGTGQVIQGWDQGIPGMKVGGIRKLIIPPDLGYGAAGSPPAIPPNSTLIFEVELIKVEKA